MTHLFREQDFHVGQELQMVRRDRLGNETYRQSVTVHRIGYGKQGSMKGVLQIGVQFRTDNGQIRGLTVLPAENQTRCTLEV